MNAQVDRAGLTGTVTDASGRVMPGVQISASLESSGLHRETVTSSTGAYDIPELPIGLYRVTYSAPGFQERVIEGMQQTIGHTRTLNVSLSIAGVLEHAEVLDMGSQLEEMSATLGLRIEPKQVKELPLNGRNWSTLTALIPGAVDTGGSNQRSIRFAGRGLDDNNFTYDGIDATNIVNQAQQPFVRLAIPTDAIQEFRIDTMLFTAENGSTPGGQIAVASKTGSNDLHGSLFEFLRNDIFDARQPIDTLNPKKPAFRLNQFGGSIGAPIVRDKTFLYFTYEGLRQTLGQTLPGFVPSDSFRAQATAANPALVPILNAFPKGNISTTGTQVSEFVGSGRQLDHEDSAMLRIDHHFSPADSAYMRFNFDASYSDIPLVQSGAYLNDRQLVTSRPVNGELESLHIFSPHLVNELKFGFNRGNVYTTNQSVLQTPYTISISGFTALSGNEYKVGVGNTFSYIDNLTWVGRGHTLKFGAEVRRVQLNQGNTPNGKISFSSAASFLANSVSSASYAAALPVNGLRKTEVYSYVQDEWKLRPNLTFNTGVRYTFYNIFHEVLNRAIPFDFVSCGPQGYCGTGASFGNTNTLDVDPRVSLIWSPSASAGKTVLRSGFGIYHGDGQLDDQNFPISNEIAQYSLSSKTVPNLSYPITPFLSNTPGIVAPREADRNRKDMYVTQWGLSVQQALPHELVGSLSYVGSKGTYLLNTTYLNLINPLTGLPPYPAFGEVQGRGNENNSSYQGFVASLQRSFTRGLLLSANYTFSHEIDQGAAGGGDSDFPQNPACPSCERSSGDFDVRHVFNSNAVYDLPFGRGMAFPLSSRVVDSIFGHWSLTGIVTARTGLPINVTEDRSSSSVATGYTISARPNIIPGVSLTPPGGRRIGFWINPAAFSLVTSSGYGNAPRNIGRGPNLWQADFGLSKRIPVTQKLQVQFRTEFFNIFNRAQYGLPLSDLSASNFGQIVGAVNTGPVGTGTPREIQFALRVEF
jgi:hypothetical protein